MKHYVIRADDEVQVENGLFELCSSCKPIIFNIYGESGVGKSWLTTRIIHTNWNLLNCLQISTVVFINFTQPGAFFNELASTVLGTDRIGNQNKIFSEMATFLERLSGICLFVIDNFTANTESSESILQLEALLRLNANVRLVVISRDRCLAASITSKIRRLNQTVIERIIVNDQNQNLLVPEIVPLACGLPVVASILRGLIHFAFEKENEMMKRIYMTILSSQTCIANTDKPSDNFVISNLLKDHHFQVYRRFLSHFLLFDKNQSLSENDLSVLKVRLDKKFDKDLLVNLGILEKIVGVSGEKSFTLHEIVYSSCLLDNLATGQDLERLRLDLCSKFSSDTIVQMVCLHCNTVIDAVNGYLTLDQIKDFIILLANESNVKEIDMKMAVEISKIVEQGFQIDFHQTSEILTAHFQGISKFRNYLFVASINVEKPYLRRYLLQNDVSVVDSVSDGRHFNGIMLACENGLANCVADLLRFEYSKIRINKHGAKGMTALLIATKRNDKEICQILLYHQCNPDLVDDDGNSALIIAASNGYSQVVEVLLHHNALVDIRNKKNENAVWLALVNGFNDVADLLFQSGATLEPGECQTLLMRSQFYKRDKTQSLMAKWFPTLSIQPINLKAMMEPMLKMLLVKWDSAVISESEFMAIAQRRELPKMKRKLTTKAAAFAIASFFGSLQSLKSLLNHHGMSVVVEKQHYRKNCTPIFVASACGHTQVVELFFQTDWKNCIEVENIRKQTPLMVAVSNGHNETASLLLRHGADLLRRDDSGISAFFIACSTGNTSIVKLTFERAIVDKIPKLIVIENATKFVGQTALMAACKGGHLDVVKILIANGIKVDTRTLNGYNALNVALVHNQIEIVKYFHLLVEQQMQSSSSGGTNTGTCNVS